MVPETSIRKWFYCPTNPGENTNSNWAGNGTNRFLGYNYFNKRGNPNLGGTSLPVNRQSGLPQPINFQARFSIAKNAASTELVCDDEATVDVAGTTWRANTSHISRGNRPDGMNVLYLDGHVAFRPLPKAGGTGMTSMKMSGTPTVYAWLVDPE
jgi:prepilin-type processing-associated H-X9-DG protein